MEIGSIVECIDASEINPNGNCKIPEQGKFYTVRGIIEKPRGSGVYLEECPDIILVNYGYKKRIELAPFLLSRFIEVEPAMAAIVKLTTKLVSKADNKLNWSIYRLEQKLDLQMLHLRYRSGYLNDIFDSLISEINSANVMGYKEYGD